MTDPRHAPSIASGSATGIRHDLIREVAETLYLNALRKVPEDAKQALRRAAEKETSETARKTLKLQLHSAEAAEQQERYVCADSGIPVYFIRIGSQLGCRVDFKKAVREGYEHLVANIDPPILQHVTDPLTQERGYHGKDIPLVSFDITGTDELEMICAPKALGSGQWADLKVFSFPSLETIETYILDVAIRAGSQHCPPVAMGVGIGGTFDHCAKMAKEATLRPLGTENSDPVLAAMERRLTDAVNSTGFGPMGTGGDTTVLGVHVDYSAGHGFTPVAVCFNCWINRRTRAVISAEGNVEWLE